MRDGNVGCASRVLAASGGLGSWFGAVVLLCAAAMPAHGQAPAPPANAHCDGTATTQTLVRLVWDAEDPAPTGYIVERQEGAGFVGVGYLDGNATSYTDTGLSADTAYTFAIISYNYDYGLGQEYDSAPTSDIDVPTLPYAPEQPQYLYAQATSSTVIQLTWPTPNGSPTSYTLTRTNPDNSTATLYPGAADTSCDDTGLTPYTYYEYQLEAQNAGGDSQPATTWAQTLPNAPSAPTSLTVTGVTSSEVDLSWTAGAAQGWMLSYNVWRTTGDGVTGTNWACVGWAYGSPTTYSDTSVSANTQYTFRVSESNEGGSSGWSNLAHATTPPYPPDEPQYLYAQATSSTVIHLTWPTPNGSPTGYTLTLTDPSNNATPIPVAGTPNSCDDTGLTPYTYYYYTLVAYNAGGNSYPAAETWAQTLPNAPSAPTSLTVAGVTSSEIDLEWTAGTAQGYMLSYNVWRTTGDGVTGTNWACVGWAYGSTTTYADTSVSANTEYAYYVTESNNAGTSPASNTVNTGASVGSPGSFSAQGVSVSEIDLTWQTPGGSPIGYTLTRTNPDSTTTTFSPGATDTAYSDTTDLQPGTSYSYALVAHGAAEDSLPATAVGTTLPEPPAAPTLSADNVAGTEVDLSWYVDPAAGGPASTYTVWRTDGDGVTSANFQPVESANSPTTAWADTTVSPGETYTYQVTASNTGGTSGPSNNVAVTTPIPAAPTDLSATAGDTHVALTWTASTGATGYKVKRSTTDGGPYTTVGTPTAASYTNTGLTNGTTYYYVVTAVNAGAESDDSDQVSSTPYLPAPGAPTSLVATPGDAQVNLTWTAGSDAATYTIKRSGVTGGPYTTVQDGITGASCSDTGLTNGTTYYYVVSATNAAGVSDDSGEASATPVAPPAAPTNLAATAGDSQVSLTWTASDGAASYNVKRSTTTGGPYTTVASPTTASCNNTGLADGTTYYYVVSAVNAGGESDNSDEVSGTPELTAPPTPGNLSASPGNAQITLTWTAADRATGYTVKRSTAQGRPYTRAGTITSAVTLTDTGLTNGTTYYYVVSATNDAGESDDSDEASATPELPAPGTPMNLIAAPGDARVTLTWTASSDAASYTVKRSTVQGGPYTAIQDGITDTSYDDTGLTNGTTYYYVVSAVNDTGESDDSGEASAPLALPTPGQPWLYATNITQTGMDLYWGAGDGGEVTTYTLRRQDVGLLTIGQDNPPLTDAGLTANTTYTYTLTATNAQGSSATTEMFTTLPDAPGSPVDLTALAVSSSEIDLSWAEADGVQGNDKVYTLFRSVDGGTTFTYLTTLPAAATTYQDTGLSAATEYIYTVCETSEGGSSPWSGQAEATTPPDAPGVPGLSATSITTTSITLAWIPGQGGAVDSYTLDRSGFGPLTIGADNPPLTDSNLIPNTTYFYTLTAHNDGGDAPATAVFTTLPDTLVAAPSAPTNLVATAVSQTEIDLSWNEAAGVVGQYRWYVILASLDDGETFTTLATVPANGETMSYQNTGLWPGATVVYTVSESNEGGNSAPSAQASATTLPDVPGTPTLSAANITQTSIDLS